MNFDHEELTLMMLYNTGTRLGLIHELRLMQCYLMPDETALRELNRRGKTPDPEHYEVTYYADLPAMWQDVPNNEVFFRCSTSPVRRILRGTACRSAM